VAVLLWKAPSPLTFLGSLSEEVAVPGFGFSSDVKSSHVAVLLRWFSLVPNLKVTMLPQFPQGCPLAEHKLSQAKLIQLLTSGILLGTAASSVLCGCSVPLPCSVVPGT
jgi:hypothetical protein